MGPDSVELPCPRCGSTKSFSKLRARRLKAREQAAPRWPPSDGSVVVGLHASATGPQSVAIGAGAFAQSDAIAINSTLAMEGQVVINDAQLDICTECGTFYSPNIKILAEELQTEINRLDPLGALADIADDPMAADGGCGP